MNPKYMVSRQQGKHLPLEVGRAGNRSQGWDPYAEESKVGSNLRGDKGLLGFCDPRMMCVFNICGVDTDT